MKIGIRGGHTQTSPGAIDYLNELTEDRRVYTKLKQLLASECAIVDLTPPESYAYPEELTYGINLANNSNLDFALSIHFNSSSTTEKPLGSEIWIWDNAKPNTKAMASNILKNLSGLGFINRGLQYSPSQRQLGEIIHTNIPWMIIEVCFVSSKADNDLYNKLGIDAVANAIAAGILGTAAVPQVQPQQQNNGIISTIQQKLNRLQIKDYEDKPLVVDNSLGPRTKYAIIQFEHIMGLNIDSGIWGSECENSYQAILSKPVIKFSVVYNQISRYVQWRIGTAIDGYFGYNSCSYLKTWQSNHGLTADASCGPLTWEKLIG